MTKEETSRLAPLTEHPPEAPLSRDVLTFAPTGNSSVDRNQDLFSPPALPRNPELMGPILRRKKVVSMPLGAGGKIFTGNDKDGRINLEILSLSLTVFLYIHIIHVLKATFSFAMEPAIKANHFKE